VLNPQLTTVVVNPAAAGGKVGRNWSEMEPELRAILGDVSFRLSERAGGAAELATEAVRKGQKTILSLGGDGTHNEVVNGIMAASPTLGEIAFGVLPSGTGGDFARILKAPRTPMGAARSLVSAPESSLDVGRVTIESVIPAKTHYFVNVGTFGITGLVDALVNESTKVLGGRASFLIGTIRGLLRYKPATVRLTVDDEPFGEFEINTVGLGNAQFCGGGMHMIPGADPGDGWFDGIIIEQRPTWKMLTLVTSIYKGTHTQCDFVHTFRAKKLRAELVGENPAFLDLDGETPGVIPATFEIVPGALKLLGELRG
jgi:YegS/Rv2252/BmrU family lipid kinase